MIVKFINPVAVGRAQIPRKNLIDKLHYENKLFLATIC